MWVCASEDEALQIMRWIKTHIAGKDPFSAQDKIEHFWISGYIEYVSVCLFW